MKKFFLSVVGLLVFLTLVPIARAQDANNNLVKNGNFEQGESGWNLKKNASEIVNDVYHSGGHSLYYENIDPKRYIFFTQKLDVKPGQLLRFSAWVKGKDIVGAGAGIFIQSQDTKGGHIMGTPYGGFPDTINGTFDWTKISGEYLVPDNEGSTQIGVYLRKGSVGKVWFDGIDVRVGAPANFFSTLSYPNYRGMMPKGGTAPLRVDIKSETHSKWNHNAKITLSLIDSNQKVLSSQSQSLSPKDSFSTIEFKVPKDLSVGNYRLKQVITGPKEQVFLTHEDVIHIVKSMPKVYIDPQGFTVVDGKRFFPLGAYTGPHGSGGNYTTNAKDADLKRMAEAGLNTVLSYGYAVSPIKDGKEFLKRAQANNLRVIYSVKDMYDGHAGYPKNGLSGDDAAKAQIEDVKNEPALLAWYTNDEMGTEWTDALKRRYNQILNLDGEHPAYMVSDKPAINEELSTMLDVLGMDPYPIGYNRDIDYVTNWTVQTVGASRGTKGIWMVPQIFNPVFAGREDKTPSLDEMRNMSYQSLVNGAKGLIYYAYHWLFFEQDENGKRVYSQRALEKRWPDVKSTFQEISSFTDVILQDNKVNLQRVIPPTTQGQTQLIDGKLQMMLPLTVQYQAWEYKDKLYVMVVNTSESNSESLNLQISGKWQLSNKAYRGMKVKQDRQILKVELSPIASGMIILEK